MLYANGIVFFSEWLIPDEITEGKFANTHGSAKLDEVLKIRGHGIGQQRIATQKTAAEVPLPWPYFEYFSYSPICFQVLRLDGFVAATLCLLYQC
jgi:hypothetical protein